MKRLRQGIYRNGINEEHVKSPKDLRFGDIVTAGTFPDEACNDLARYFVRTGMVYGEWVGLSVHHILRIILQEVIDAEYKALDEQSILIRTMIDMEKADLPLEKLVTMGAHAYLELRTIGSDFVYFPTKKFIQKVDMWQGIAQKRGV